jgi:alpha-glucosidase
LAIGLLLALAIQSIDGSASHQSVGNPSAIRPQPAILNQPATLNQSAIRTQSTAHNQSAIRNPQSAIDVVSPNTRVAFELSRDGNDRLIYTVTRDRRGVIDASPLGIVVDGKNLGDGARIGHVEPYQIDERYPWLGVHSTAVNRCRGVRVALGAWTLDARACDDGAAFRYIVPGAGGVDRTPDEATTFRLPPGSVVWSHDFEGHYEGMHVRRNIEDVPIGEWAAPPLTIKLPGGRGYASITESALAGYSGMALRADGHGGYAARLGHEEPVSYPYRLRYKPEDIERLSRPATVSGTITTPWRAVITGAALNELVNSDLVHNLSPAADRMIFPDGVNTPWVRPGRAVWRFLDGGDNTFDGLKQFTGLAERLGFEYHVVEGIWQRWTDDQLREFVDDAKRRHVGIWLWKDSRALTTREEQRAFFDKCRELGVVGAKVDFFDHEAKEMIDRYQSLLREAAERHIMLDFHGANKPTGESRTWPNELTREGVYGLEHRQTESWGRHNTTLPFTRLLAGPADYTPVVFGERRKETSWAHQIATAAIFTSPLLVYGAHPQSLLDNPAVDIVKSLPSVWDETIVLPPSEIGEVAAFARRRGTTWYVAVANGPDRRTVRIDLSFLEPARYDALIARDQADDPAAVKIEKVQLTRTGSLTDEMRPGGGFIARLTKTAATSGR